MIGERLQELRKDKGVSQAELAALLGVSHYTVSSYECNRSDPDDKIKIKIAEYFDISVDYLLGLINEPYSYKRSESVILLPKDFSKEDEQELLKFMQYLKFKKR